jgi:hypothetical protein
MIGKRVEFDPSDPRKHLQPGDYGKAPDGTWYARPPWEGGNANLQGHKVTEHADGTITVEPSIKVEAGFGYVWHGFLENGVWRGV